MKYRHTATGGVRESSRALGFPWVALEEAAKEDAADLEGKTRAELAAMAEAKGLDTAGTKAELAKRLAEAAANG